ncbi:putative polyamine transporter [Tothia fuscella]|uniref:Polyamine transporter n=1 Tax=Tothia fuscella TaxID=1048955 RepID=A0A9P4P118_9PEZI|nr:putative polyamine transporter [Tothia fuscella]
MKDENDAECPSPDDDDLIREAGLQKTHSGYVEWQKDHSEYPRNWRLSRKIYDTTIIVFLEFYTTVISTTGPSAAKNTMNEHQISRTLSLVAFTFMYQLGQALGGLLMPPMSESFGRRKAYIYSSAVFSIASLITGVVPHVAGVYVGRVIAGFASAIPSVVLAGSIEDMYRPRVRVWLILLWNSFTTLGLCMGPIYGSYISHAIGWRWIYYTSAILTASLCIPLSFIRESRSSKLLSQKHESLKGKTNQDDLRIHETPDNVSSRHDFIHVVLFRPLRLATTEPIVIMVSVLNATAWGIIYLFTECLTIVYAQRGWTDQTSSLSFLAIGTGIVISLLPRFRDLKLMKQGRSEPEDKLTGFAIGAPSLAIGLWLFAWTIPPRVRTHWLPSMLGLLLVGFATNEFAYTLNGYLADSYSIYAASSLAALALTRALVSGVMPLFAHQMFTGLDTNLAASVLAAVATLYCVAPVVFLKYGKQMREASEFARHSAEVNKRHGEE